MAKKGKAASDGPVKWLVCIPITGFVTVEVTATTESEAIEKGFDVDGFGDPEEWEVHRSVTEGNVFHGVLNEAYAERVKS
jgi:hypothetical protein